MFKGEPYDFGDVVIFLVKVAMCAMLLGFAVGWAFTLWIRVASNRFSHFSGLIQISLTLCCAYTSFILAEGVLHISGVLSTVAAALVLAGSLFGNTMVTIPWGDYFHLLVIYAVQVVLR